MDVVIDFLPSCDINLSEIESQTIIIIIIINVGQNFFLSMHGESIGLVCYGCDVMRVTACPALTSMNMSLEKRKDVAVRGWGSYFD